MRWCSQVTPGDQAPEEEEQEEGEEEPERAIVDVTAAVQKRAAAHANAAVELADQV